MTSRVAHDFGRTDLWAAHGQLRRLANEVFGDPASGRIGNSRRRAIVLLLYAKGLKSYNAILRLCERGYGEDAAILLRALFQTAVTARYLTQRDFRRRYARYDAYQWILKKRILEPAIKAGTIATPKYIKGEQYSWEQIKAFARRARIRYGKMTGAMGWMGQKLEQVARSLGYQEVYDSLYRHTSEYEHTSLRAAETYARGQGRVMTRITSQPSDRLVNEILGSLLWVMCVLMDVVDETFRLGKGEEITSSLRTFHERSRPTLELGE